MSATEGASTTALQKHGRTLSIAILVASLLGAGATFYFYKRYADVWLRAPPRMPQCMFISRRLLSHEENVSGSIPHIGPDGNIVYLRPFEDHAVTCMARVSTSTAPLFVAAFAEVDPDKRAHALASILLDHVSKDTAADPEAVASWLIASGAFKALPKTPEIEKLSDEIDQQNACRFALHSTCPSRPPIPNSVWIFGVPSSVGLVVTFGWGAKAITARLSAWWEKRRAAKKLRQEKPKNTKTNDPET